MNFTFFGTSRFSVIILDQLKSAGFVPSLIVTVPDQPKGRKLIMTPPEVKVWAEREKIPCIQPETLKASDAETAIRQCGDFDFFIVASYGKIIPQAILDIPKLGTLNVHPSLLPKYRGASPLQCAILNDNETGVTIMRLDALMDHGPIVFQKKTMSWSNDNMPYEEELEQKLGQEGGEMLSSILPDWAEGKITEKEQDHSMATICGKIEKTDGELNLSDSSEKNLRKIRAYHTWPTAYYFVEHHGRRMRIVVKRAHIEEGLLILDRVIPEGKKEMDYKDFLKGFNN